MYESEVIHLYPSIKKCFVCDQELEEWYRTERNIKTLEGQKDIVCHKFRCKNKKCNHYHNLISPEEENRLALKSKTMGLDVILEIGRLRYKEHKTWKEIQTILKERYNFLISHRAVGYQEKDYLALINIVAKNNNKLLLHLRNLNGIIIAIDGIKPDSGDEQLFLIREIQTGQILASKLISYTTREEIEELIQEVIDLKLPILGIISDNDGMQKGALKNKLPNIPHQICQYHFLKQLTKPLKLADTKVKKIKTTLLELRKVEKELFKDSNPKTKIAKDYFLAVKNIIKIKSNFPMKPGSIRIYDKLLAVKKSIENCFVFEGHAILRKIYTFVSRVIHNHKKEIQQLKIPYSWIYKIASLIDVSNTDEVKAKSVLKNYVNSIPIQESGNLEHLRKHIKKLTISWLPNMFTYLSFPSLPKTNNGLEHFNCYVKRVYRKITGRKNAQLFLVNYGETVAFLLSMDKETDLHSIFSLIPYNYFVYVRNEITAKTKRSKIFSIQRSLQDFLFQLEINWSLPKPKFLNP